MSCMNQKGTQDVAAMATSISILRPATAKNINDMPTACISTSNKMQPPSTAPISTSTQATSVHSKLHADYHVDYANDQVDYAHDQLRYIASTNQDIKAQSPPTAPSHVLVAVNAAKLNRHALEWALTNVVQSADHVTLLALWPTGGKRLNWSLPLISGDCARRAIARRRNGNMADVEEEVNDCCSCMLQGLRTLCDSKKVTVKIKVVPDAERGTIAAQAEKTGATWVVLDKHVMSTREGKVCMEQLDCNVVLVKQGKSSKILRLNLKGTSQGGFKADRKENDHQHTNTELRAHTISNYHEKPWPDTNIKSGSDLVQLVYYDARRGIRSNKKSTSARNRPAKHKANNRSTGHSFSFYDRCDDHSVESSPEGVSARIDPFLIDSDTAAYMGAADVYNVGSLVADHELNMDTDHEVGSISDHGELNFFVNVSDERAATRSTGHDELHLHSGILMCTPASSSCTASPSLEEFASEQQTLMERFENSPCAAVGQETDWYSEGYYALQGPCSPAGKLAPKSNNICPFTCSSKPNSASTTPNSETLTLTGSSYPKLSPRSPSPAPPASTNEHQPPLSSNTNQHAPRASNTASCILNARASRSPSPSKSNCTTSSPAVSVTLSSSLLSPSSACSGPGSTLLTSTREKQSSRSHPLTSPVTATQSVIWASCCPGESLRHEFIASSRKSTDQTTSTSTSFITDHPITALSSARTFRNVNGSPSTLRGADSRAVTTRELMQRFAEWDHQSTSTKYDPPSPSATASYGSFRIKGYKEKFSGAAHVGSTELSKNMVDDLQRTSSVRRAMSRLGGDADELFRHPAPPGPPPLCSICQHKAPVFGKPPRRFSYAELEMATAGFSSANFLAEGGFGCVHRGVLPDGQAVAVKQHKLASSQGDIEFCSEVEVLSCAQHRNVVMLIGYCIEDSKRLLVYEFICNGSLDSHLYGAEGNPLPWSARQKVAIGAARGLRYLHEECRVGCIIHRDVRPNNILLTHDYEPMVGDFGLARWQPDGDFGVQTRVIGTFGYLAPEYAQSGEVTEKADVYSFGVVLLELVTGRKAVELARPKGQQCLTEWARPLLEEGVDVDELLDPQLQDIDEYELFCNLHAASLCICKDPRQRPRMSQVLRILEGDVVIDHSGPSTPLYFGRQKQLYHQHEQPPCLAGNFNGSRSGRIFSDYYHPGGGAGASQAPTDGVSPPLISYSGSLLAGIGESSGHFAEPLVTRRRSGDAFHQHSSSKLDNGSYHDAAKALLSLNNHCADTYSKRFSFEAL